MKWALLLWATSPGAYQVHSVYIQHGHCVQQAIYYQRIFKETNAKMHMDCRPAREVKLNVANDVYYDKQVFVDN